MNKYILVFLHIIIFSLILSGCSKTDTPEKAVNEIIEAYNTKNIEVFWDRTMPSDKYAISKNMLENIENRDLFEMMGYVLEKDNVTPDNITAEEYLYGTFKVILGDKEMELKSLEKIDDNTYTATILIGEKQAVMPLRKENDKWYMQVE